MDACGCWLAEGWDDPLNAVAAHSLESRRVKVQFRGINLKANQLKANDKVNPSAIFKSTNEKINSICSILKIY